MWECTILHQGQYNIISTNCTKPLTNYVEQCEYIILYQGLYNIIHTNCIKPLINHVETVWVCTILHQDWYNIHVIYTHYTKPLTDHVEQCESVRCDVLVTMVMEHGLVHDDQRLDGFLLSVHLAPLGRGPPLLRAMFVLLARRLAQLGLSWAIERLGESYLRKNKALF